MKKLAYCAVLFLGFCVPSFAAVHVLSRTAKVGYRATKGTAKAAYRVGKYAGRQVF